MVVILIAIYGLVSWTIVSGVTDYDRKFPEATPAAYGLEYEDVEFVSRTGDVTLSGWYIPGEGEGPTILFVHGIGSVRTGDESLDIASRLIPQGFSVLLFDLRGHGNSEEAFISGGYFERYDVLGAFDYLVARGISPERIGILSFSMGAATATMAVAEETSIHALVVDSPYAKASDMIARETALQIGIPEWIAQIFIPGVKLTARVRYDIDVGAMVPEEAVELIPYPIMVIHGTADTRIPWEHGVRVYEAAYPGSSIWLVPGVEHTDAFSTYPEEYVEKIVDYFDGQLGSR